MKQHICFNVKVKWRKNNNKKTFYTINMGTAKSETIDLSLWEKGVKAKTIYLSLWENGFSANIIYLSFWEKGVSANTIYLSLR